jgi:hypothetical protein
MKSRVSVQVIAIVLVALIAATACLFFGNSGPRVLNHPQPDVFVDQAGFDDTLCPEQNGQRMCAPQSELGALGCEQIRPAGDILGGLRPIYPIRVCLAGRQPGAPEPPKNEYLFREGCRLARYVRYVILKDGKVELIGSQNDLQRIYAPIENNLEAQSYALAASGLGVRYGLQPEPGLRYFVSELQDTYVQQIERGFQVHLYDYQVCGCGPHPTYAVDLLVTPLGELEELSREKVFEDPAEDGLCVD